MASDLSITRSSSQSHEETNLHSNASLQHSMSMDEQDTTIITERPAFCMNENERKERSFQERKTDVDGAIEWIKKEIKSLKQADQNLMRQFVNLRSILNSLKNRPTLDRKISLPENSPTSPLSPLYRISEDSPETFYGREGSPGLRRRTQSAFAGAASEYPLSPFSLDGSDFGEDDGDTTMF